MLGFNILSATRFAAISILVGAPFVSSMTGCGDSGEPPTEVSVRVTEYVSLSDLQGPLPDAEVCETDTNNCVTTDAEGIAIIELPSDSEVSYTITKEGFGSYLITDVTNTELEHGFWMYPDQELERLAELMGTTYPWTDTGVILLRAYTDPGVVFDLVGESNTPFYFVTGDTPSTEVESTTQDGRGGFTDLAPGDYQVDFAGAPVLCQPFTTWPGDVDNRVKIPVKAGYISYSSMSCGQLPPQL